MGFLKRLFSIGSKKHKKSKVQHQVPLPLQLDPIPEAPAQNEEENEAAIRKLLRSSSARYAVAAEVDYSNIPPIPHPINNVLCPPSASTVSLASTTMSSRGTYSVTVHGRKRHGSTDPAEILEPTTPKKRYDTHLNANDSRILRLRSDPSVASLVSLYDEHGRLPDEVFSNSPPSPERIEKPGKAQCKRSGSTLRQLLGAPIAGSINSRNGSGIVSEEGDISWAERFLGESDGNSTHSSLPLPTPISAHAPFMGDISISSQFSDITCDNPAFSSMDVELSVSTNASEIFDHSFNETKKDNSPYRNPDPATPQRASQVFGFITKKRQSKFVEDDERILPELPSAFSSPSTECCGTSSSSHDQMRSHFSEDSCESALAHERISAIPIPSDTPRNSRPVSTQIESTMTTYEFGKHDPQDIKRFSFNVYANTNTTMTNSDHTAQDDKPFERQVQDTDDMNTNIKQDNAVCNQILTPQDPFKTHDVKVLMTGPTKVIVTAPTPGTANYNLPTTRIPRGPRAPSSRRRTSNSSNRSSDRHRRSTNLEHSYTGDRFTAAPSRRRTSHHRTSSLCSNSPAAVNENDENNRPYERRGVKEVKYEGKAKKSVGGGETNGARISLSVNAEIPPTPLRSHNSNHSTSNSRSGARPSHNLFRTAVHSGTYQPPPATNFHLGRTPSPASSTEMSPTGKQIMMDLRQQRMKAREAERERSGLYAITKRAGSTTRF